VHEKPSFQDAGKILREALEKHLLIIVTGNCRVNYEGRASSTLDWGNRFAIIKTDASVLIHRPSGYEPVNWQPSGCVFNVMPSERELYIRAVRLQPKETLKIYFNLIFNILVSNLIDEGQFDLYVSESDMKKALLTDPSLIEDGLKPISSEKILEDAGFADIFAEDSNGNFVIVEIKRNPAGKEAVYQLERYVKTAKKKVNRTVRGIIAAPVIQREAQLLLASRNFEYKRVPLRKCYQLLKFKKTPKLLEFNEKPR
jgi:hypothetical protein